MDAYYLVCWSTSIKNKRQKMPRGDNKFSYTSWTWKECIPFLFTILQQMIMFESIWCIPPVIAIYFFFIDIQVGLINFLFTTSLIFLANMAYSRCWKPARNLQGQKATFVRANFIILSKCISWEQIYIIWGAFRSRFIDKSEIWLALISQLTGYTRSQHKIK